MNEFIAKHAEGIAGVLSGFDRLVFRGTLRLISYPEGMMGYLSGSNVRLTGFGQHVLQVSERLKQACTAKAEARRRPVKYLASGAESREVLSRSTIPLGKPSPPCSPPYAQPFDNSCRMPPCNSSPGGKKLQISRTEEREETEIGNENKSFAEPAI